MAKAAVQSSERITIIREELLREVIEASSASVFLLVAPAGYGKTTLLSQHYAQKQKENVSTIWMDCDQDLADASAFAARLQDLIAAESRQIKGAETSSSEQDFQTMANLFDLTQILVRRLERLERQTFIYLDDLEKLTGTPAGALVARLFKLLPPNARLLTASRLRPEGEIAKLTTMGQLVEITSEQLRFSEHEIEEIIARTDSPENVERFLRQMEGWPVSLAFVHMAGENGLLAGGMNSGMSEGGHGRNMRRVSDYLSEQVFQKIPEDLKNFLLKIAFPEQINADLANAITEQTNGGQMLERVCARNLFVHPLSKPGSWYRLHQIFRDFLIERLTLSIGEEIKDIHCRIARWYSTHGNVGPALRHAVETGDLELLNEVLLTSGGWTASLGQGTNAWRYYDRFSDAQIANYPQLVLCRVHLCAHRGEIERARKLLRTSQPKIAVMEREGRSAQVGSMLQAGWEGLDLLVANFEEWPAPAQALERFKNTAIHRVRPVNKVTAISTELLSWLYNTTGEFGLAVQTSARGSRMCERTGAYFIKLYSDLAGGYTYSILGQPDEARTLIDRSYREACQILGASGGTTLAIQAFQAMLIADAGDPIRAADMIASSKEVIVEGEVWHQLAREFYRILAWGEFFRNGLKAALDTLDDGLTVFSDRPMRRTEQALALLKVRFYLAAGEPAQAQAVAEALELEKKVWRGDQVSVQEWQLSFPATQIQVWLDIASGNLAAAAKALDALKLFVARTQARKFLPELLLSESLLALISEKEYAASVSLMEALRAAEETENRLPLLVNLPHMKMITSKLLSSGHLAAEDRVLLAQYLDWPRTAAGEDQDAAPAKRPIPAGLNTREGQVFWLLTDGFTSKEIARELGISVNTAQGYRKSLYHKLRISRRSRIVEISRKLLSEDG